MGWSFADLLSIWYLSGGAFPPGEWGHPYLGELDGNPDVISLEEANLLSSRLLDHVLSFEIVGYGIYENDGTYRYVPVRFDDPSTPGVNEETPQDDLEFDPNENKPLWIEFEITLRDSNNRLKEGYTSRYRVNLPSR